MRGATWRVPSFVFGESLLAFVVFHGLVWASLLVTAGVMLAFHRRLTDRGAAATQQFGEDVMPLVMLLAISVTGLMLTASFTWMKGYAYDFLAILHAATVIITLLWLPFGKLSHAFLVFVSRGTTAIAFAPAEALMKPVTETQEQDFNTAMVVSAAWAGAATPRVSGAAWAAMMRDEFGAQDPRSMMLRFHTQTAGSTLTAQIDAKFEIESRDGTCASLVFRIHDPVRPPTATSAFLERNQ